MFIRRLSEQIMGQYIKIDDSSYSLKFNPQESLLIIFNIGCDRIHKLDKWWSMNRNFRVNNNCSIQMLLDTFFG